MKHWTSLKTLAALGPASIARVGLYRLGLKSGRHPVQRIVADVPAGPLFATPQARPGLPPPNRRWTDRLWWFGWFSMERSEGTPDWHLNPFTNARGDQTRPWWTIPDFAGSGDIKGVWELSRFGWLASCATQAAHGDTKALATINQWLQSWLQDNPPYLGVNWKCGQEAALRVIHLMAAALVLDQDRTPQPMLAATIALHLKRIAPTMSYAIGQDNNHGTSEAAAMFIGGSFLSALGWREARTWARTGRRWLENRARHLIAPDGSFSQYSIVYHRLMLDTFSFVEVWRRRHDLAPFSATMRNRLDAATAWLDAMVDRTSGDTPNLGANDGAHILPLTETDYRDFRPSLQLASVLFRGQRAMKDTGSWDDQLHWLGLSSAIELAPEPVSTSFDNGGFHVLRNDRATACLRYPRFRFRPSQSDLLHLDLWADGRNLLRDAGSFSYNAAPDISAYFAGTAAHNSIEFNGRDQMPRLSRFLFGAWPKAREVRSIRNPDNRCAAAFTDDRGMFHHRDVSLQPDGFTCVDTISGPFDNAILRWRLLPGLYQLEGHHLIGAHLQLSISCDDPNFTMHLTTGAESRYYLHQAEIPVLEIRLKRPCRIDTTGKF
ncbi:heparinase II/III family protein [Sphingobium scionense]|uniref:Heparinase n=1 Tax=Sphingobium scionense TaxID=1404341 RepID=A0A7W6LV76_9SPHN|nr:heparinase II/III-family protein [Sphingobium scionense]MBB4151100.1 hypothetical protein [Sphingobium scionense]